MRLCALLALAFTLVTPASSAARNDPIRNSLPPPAPPLETNYDDVLFWDAFSGNLDAWHADREGVWSVRGGMLRADLPDRKGVHSFLFAGDSTWTDYSLEFHVLAMRGVDKGAAIRVHDNKGIAVDLRGIGYHDVILHRQIWRLGQASVINANGMWHHMRIEARGPRYRVWVDGEPFLDVTDKHSGQTQGGIALAAFTGGGGECTIYYDNVVVRKLAPEEDPEKVTAVSTEKTD